MVPINYKDYEFFKEDDARNLEKELIATGNIDLRKLSDFFIKELKELEENFDTGNEPSGIEWGLRKIIIFIVQLSGKSFEGAEKFVESNKLITEKEENYENAMRKQEIRTLFLFGKEIIEFDGYRDEDGVPHFLIRHIAEENIKKAL